jgi:phosphonopyruvate decarboxylase
VLDGDGSLLMELGSLATIAGAAPANLTHFVLRNGVYQSSGGQATPGGSGVDFVGLALAAGYREARVFAAIDDFERSLPHLLTARGPLLAELRVGAVRTTPDEDYGCPTFAGQAAALRDALREGSRGEGGEAA